MSRFISNDEDVITLEYEDGSVFDYEIMGKFDFEDKTYIALLSKIDPDEVILFGCEEENNGFYLKVLEDDEWDTVVNEFDRIIEEEW